jgi:Glycosyl hydrolase family 65 central catalytic domain
VPAKGLTSQTCDGHYFWDMYMLPFLIYTAPRLAENLLRFRYSILEKARARAREVNQKGDLFPWRTINGEESSANYAAGTAQYHINAAVAHGIIKSGSPEPAAQRAFGSPPTAARTRAPCRQVVERSALRSRRRRSCRWRSLSSAPRRASADQRDVAHAQEAQQQVGGEQAADHDRHDRGREGGSLIGGAAVLEQQHRDRGELGGRREQEHHGG